MHAIVEVLEQSSLLKRRWMDIFAGVNPCVVNCYLTGVNTLKGRSVSIFKEIFRVQERYINLFLLYIYI